MRYNCELIFGVIRDVTADRLAEERLRQASQLARLAGRIAKLGSWRVDYAPPRIIWSDETAAIHGEPAGFTPQLEVSLNYFPAEDRARLLVAVEECRAQGTPFDPTFPKWHAI
jgi:hypothetical protein